MIPKIKTILYASDLGTHMRPAFRMAVSLAEQYKAKIVVMHVLEPLSATSQSIVETYLSKKEARRLHDEGYQEVQKKMHKRLDKFCEEELGVTVAESKLVSKILVTQGNPAERIVQEAGEQKADIIVMGTHTEQTIGHALLGSIARKVTHMSKLPVLVVPAEKEKK